MTLSDMNVSAPAVHSVLIERVAATHDVICAADVLGSTSLPSFVIDAGGTVLMANREGDRIALQRRWYVEVADEAKPRFKPMLRLSNAERLMTAYVLNYLEDGPSSAEATIPMHVKRIERTPGAAVYLVLVSSLVPNPACALAVIGSHYGLSRTELRILGHVYDGLSSTEIAEAQRMSVHTVRSHTKAVMKKIGTNPPVAPRAPRVRPVPRRDRRGDRPHRRRVPLRLAHRSRRTVGRFAG